ncbi:hypothetical protein C3E99_07065 [Sphingopyxis sp. MG]|nr:hypothetical protein C3E99_07065 [Sphingopyxis sp. MG]
MIPPSHESPLLQGPCLRFAARDQMMQNQVKADTAFIPDDWGIQGIADLRGHPSLRTSRDGFRIHVDYAHWIAMFGADPFGKIADPSPDIDDHAIKRRNERTKVARLILHEYVMIEFGNLVLRKFLLRIHGHRWEASL